MLKYLLCLHTRNIKIQKGVGQMKVKMVMFAKDVSYQVTKPKNALPSINKKCKRCDKIGHYAQACTSSLPGPRSGTGHANAIRAYVEHLSPNDLAVFNAQQIEKAENCGLVYNVETNDVENPENMTRHQRAGMFGHLN